MRQLRHLILGIDPSFGVNNLRVSHALWAFKLWTPMLCGGRGPYGARVVEPAFAKTAQGFFAMCTREPSLRVLHYACLDRHFGSSPPEVPTPLLWALWGVQGAQVPMGAQELLRGISEFRPVKRPAVKSALLWWLLGMKSEACIELLHGGGIKLAHEEALFEAFISEIPSSPSFRWWLVNPDTVPYPHLANGKAQGANTRRAALCKPYIRAQLRVGRSFTGAPRYLYGYRGITFATLEDKITWFRQRGSFPHRVLRNGQARKAPSWWE